MTKTTPFSRRFLFGALLLLPLLTGIGKAHAGPDVASLVENGCDACHRLEASIPEEGRKGPDLFFSGNKFQKQWLLNWLQSPQPVRPSGYTSDPGFLEGKPTVAVPHPAADAPEAQALTEALMQMKVEGLETAPPEVAEPLSKGLRFKIKILFERDYGCIACHQTVNLVGEPRGGVSGPTLLNAGDRLQAEWVYNWLKTPARFEPKSRMPVFDLTEEERIQLTRYVMWHKTEKEEK